MISRQTVIDIVTNLLPTKFIKVEEYKDRSNEINIYVSISYSNYEINSVKNQYFEHMSFIITPNNKLEFRVFGGTGGQYIYRNIDKNIEKEKYLALGKEKIKFRSSKSIEENIQKVCLEYTRVIEDINKRGLSRVK